MEIGLNFYVKDYEDYPESAILPKGATTDIVCGAHHFAEALVGRDLKGFDPWMGPGRPGLPYGKYPLVSISGWCAPEEKNAGVTERYANVPKGSTVEEIRESLSRRRGPYMEPKDMGAFDIGQLYYGVGYAPACAPVYTGSDGYRSPVLTDIYHNTRAVAIDDNGVMDLHKAGAPILYYKANVFTRLFMDRDEPDYKKWIYNYDDNRAIIELGTVKNPIIKHNFDEQTEHQSRYRQGEPIDGVELFYETIKNPKVSYDKPFNADTYILISAGYDGIFGTKDDITNLN